jgi:hypothetical protein
MKYAIKDLPVTPSVSWKLRFKKAVLDCRRKTHHTGTHYPFMQPLEKAFVRD